MSFDINALTLGEVDKIETLSGQSISTMGEDANPKGKMLAAMVFVAKRREQLAAGEKPSFTFNEALGLGLTEAKGILGMTDEPATEDEDPTEDPAEDPTSPEE